MNIHTDGHLYRFGFPLPEDREDSLNAFERAMAESRLNWFAALIAKTDQPPNIKKAFEDFAKAMRGETKEREATETEKAIDRAMRQ